MSGEQTITTLRDVLRGVRGYFRTALTGIVEDPTRVVNLADFDERANTERFYPAAALQIYDVQIDNSRRTGGPGVATDHDGESSQATLSKIGTPVVLHFQLDVFAEKKPPIWAAGQKLLALLGAQIKPKVVTEDGKELCLFEDTVTNLDKLLESNLYRTSYRFHTPVFFPNPEDASQAYVVLTARLNMKGQLWALSS